MGWERRKRGGLYYTRSKRVGGRVVREYVGCGATAQAIATLDAMDREEREVARARRDHERAGPLAVEGALGALSASLDALVGSTLEAHGYHARKGQWRRRRNS